MAIRESLEPPDGETSTEKVRRLWILKALQQTSYVSHMAREICNDTNKAGWTQQTYREYRRLLDEEMMTVCQIYAEVALADLPVREGKEARRWLKSAHRDTECAREHIGTRIRGLEERRALLYPVRRGSKQRQARHKAYLESRGANAKSQEQARGAAEQARLQANRTPEVAAELPGGVSFTRPETGMRKQSPRGPLWEDSPDQPCGRCGSMPQSLLGCGAPCRPHPGFADAGYHAE